MLAETWWSQVWSAFAYGMAFIVAMALIAFVCLALFIGGTFIWFWSLREWDRIRDRT